MGPLVANSVQRAMRKHTPPYQKPVPKAQKALRMNKNLHANIQKDLLEDLKWIMPHPPNESGDWYQTEATALADLCVEELEAAGDIGTRTDLTLAYILFAVWKRYGVVSPTPAAADANYNVMQTDTDFFLIVS